MSSPATDASTTRWRRRRRLAEGPHIAIRFNKRLVNKELENRVNKLYDLALALEAITFETADHREAVQGVPRQARPRLPTGRGNAGVNDWAPLRTAGRFVGQSVLRKRGPVAAYWSRPATPTTSTLPGMLHADFVRSDLARRASRASMLPRRAS